MSKLYNIKRLIFLICLIIGTLFSVAYICFAKSASYRYPNGYVMDYNLIAATVSGSSGAGATTKTENEAVAFASIFSYKGSTVKNSGTKQQDFYVYLAITGNGGNTFKSYHSLKDEKNVPLGQSLYLEIN